MKYSMHMGVAALALSFAGAALAADAMPKPATPAMATSPFASLDTNKDGRLSQAEIHGNADLNGRFSTLDTDGDTYLSQSEYGKWDGSAQRVPITGDPSQGNSTRGPSDTSPDKAGADKPMAPPAK